jgi:endonuclease YncB( thermonuclease family)
LRGDWDENKFGGLQAMMVSAGWAWSFGRFSERYAPEEKDAATQKAGVHGHRCVAPWEWRAQERAKPGE